MPVHRVVCLAVLLTSILCVSPGQAATIRLKTGREMSGEIVSETPEGVSLRMAGGKMFIPRSRIAEIVRDGAPSPPGRPTPDRPAASPSPREAAEAISVFQAIGGGRIRIEATGEGIASVRLRVVPIRPDERPVRIPPGAIFVPRTRPGTKPAQTLVVTAPVAFGVGDGPVTVHVPVASANRDRRVPEGKDVLDLRKDGASESLRRLAPHLARGSTASRQAAVWIVTDDATYEDLGRLAVTVKDPDTGRTIRRRAIDPGVTATAMKLIDDCGLRLSARRIWKSRALLVSVIVPDSSHPADRGLATWARTKLAEYGADVPAIVVGILGSRAKDGVIREACRVAANHRIRAALPALRKLSSAASRSLAARTDATQAIAIIVSAPTSRPPDRRASSGLEEILALLPSNDRAGRRKALLTLVEASGRIPHGPMRRKVGAALVAEIRPPQERLTNELFRAVETYRDAIDPATMIGATRSSDPRVRLAAVRLLVHFRTEAVTARITHLLRDPDAGTCLAALFAAGNHPKAWPSIVHLLEHGAPVVRQRAAAALAVVTPGAAEVAALARLLRDDDADVRAVAATTLGSPNYTGTRQAEPDLADRLRTDTSGIVRIHCAYALTAILGNDALGALESALERAKSSRERKALEDCIRGARRPGRGR